MVLDQKKIERAVTKNIKLSRNTGVPGDGNDERQLPLIAEPNC
jgi:hypothetical protein